MQTRYYSVGWKWSGRGEPTRELRICDDDGRNRVRVPLDDGESPEQRLRDEFGDNVEWIHDADNDQ